MSTLLSRPIQFVDDDELKVCIEIFSDRVRQDAIVRPALNRLVGNRWEDAELQVHSFFHAMLFRDARPHIEPYWLARAAWVLTPVEVDRLTDVLQSCVLETFPIGSAGELYEVVTELANTLKSIIVTEGLERQRQLLGTLARINAGALLNAV